MKSLGRVLFIIAVIVSGLTTWLNLSWKSIEQFTNSPSESRIDYYLSGFTLTQTNTEGLGIYQLTGQHLTHQQGSSASEIFKPHIKATDSTGNIITLDADKALQTAMDGTMSLQGDIRIHKPKSPESPEFTLKTQNLIYNPKSRQISTESDIHLLSPSGTLTGTGIQTQLDEQELRILSNVQAEFQTP